MSDSKTYVFDSGANNLSSMLPALLQNRGIDSSYLAGLMNGNNNGGFFGNNGGFQDIIALIVIAAIFGNGNFGFGNNGNNSSAERELLMQTLNRNGVDIGQLAQSVNCSTGQINNAINSVATQISNLAGQQGLSAQQIINSIQAGNCTLSHQIADCCCSTKQVLAQGFADLGYATRDQTCSIEKAIASSTAQILEGQRAAEMRDLTNKLEAEREKVSQQATAINNYQQTQTFAAMLQPISSAIGGLQSDLDKVKCKLPETFPVQYQPFTAVPNCVAYGMGLYGGVPFNNTNGSFF